MAENNVIKKEVLYRPPISKRREAMLEEIAAELNKDSVFHFTKHNVLDAVIDRAYEKTFPKAKGMPKRKRYITFPF